MPELEELILYEKDRIQLFFFRTNTFNQTVYQELIFQRRAPVSRPEESGETFYLRQSGSNKRED